MELLTNTRQVLWEKMEMPQGCKDAQRPQHTQYNCHSSWCWLQSCSGRGGGLPKRSRTASRKNNVQHIGRYQFCQGAEYKIFSIRFRLSQLPLWQCLIIKEGSSVLISGQRRACNSSASEQDNICKKSPQTSNCKYHTTWFTLVPRSFSALMELFTVSQW